MVTGWPEKESCHRSGWSLSPLPPLPPPYHHRQESPPVLLSHMGHSDFPPVWLTGGWSGLAGVSNPVWYWLDVVTNTYHSLHCNHRKGNSQISHIIQGLSQWILKFVIILLRRKNSESYENVNKIRLANFTLVKNQLTLLYQLSYLILYNRDMMNR